MTEVREKLNCRLCMHGDLRSVFKLPDTPLANDFRSTKSQHDLIPLEVVQCAACGHSQLRHVVDPKLLFSNYAYVSGTSPSFVRHFEGYALAVSEQWTRAHALSTAKYHPLVVEIGSNDGTLLKAFQKLGWRVLGVEPAVNLALKAEVPTISGFFTEDAARDIAEGYGRADAVVANNVLAHIDDLDEVMRGVKTLFAPTGVFVFEVQYLGDLLAGGMFDLCLPPEEHVVVRGGTKPIAEVREGDEALTHLGRFKAVTKTFRRQFAGNLVEISAYGQNHPLRVTPEHPVYVRRKTGHKVWGLGEFLPAKDVKPGDRVLKPGVVERRKTPWISITTKTDRWGNTKTSRFRVGHDLMRVLGYYMAEGSYATIGKKKGKDCAAASFAFGLSAKEERLANKCAESIRNLGSTASVYLTKYGWHVNTYGPLARLLKRELGNLAENKHAPYWLLESGDNLVETFLRAYADGDGYEYRDRRYLRACTVSPQLAQGVALLANQIGWACSVNKSNLPWKPRTIASNPKPTLSAFPPYDILIRVKPKKANKVCFEAGYQHGTVYAVNHVPYSGEVCNFEVDEDHSYVTPLTAVHNCYHEHLDYHALFPLVRFFRRHDLHVFDAERVPTHGGSLRIWVSRPGRLERTLRTDALLREEEPPGLIDEHTWKPLAAKVEKTKTELRTILDTFKARKANIVAYGAPAKLTTFCYGLGLTADDFDYVCDDSPLKQGKYTPGLNIPVLPPSALIDSTRGWPDLVVITAWNFSEQILAKLKPLIDGGTNVIVPFPEVKVL